MSTAQPRSEFKISPGDVIAGKYRVERVLGAGGMGLVVSAHHIQLDEKVALKFLLPEVAKVGEAVARFDREARAAVKIKSEGPNCVRAWGSSTQQSVVFGPFHFIWPSLPHGLMRG